MSKGREKGTDWLLQFFGTSSEMVRTAAKMCQLAGLAKDSKIHNLLKKKKKPEVLRAHFTRDIIEEPQNLLP